MTSFFQRFPFFNVPHGRFRPHPVRLGAAAALLALAVGGCTSTPFGGTKNDGPSPLPAAPSGTVTTSPLGTTNGKFNMTGRWILSSPGSSQCGMNFRGTPGAIEGTIAPEGGCPGNFFTSRHWTIENNSLVIRDHNQAPLAQLASTTPNQFQGKAVSGITVTLMR